MKNILIFIIVYFWNWSCNDILTEEPKSFLTPQGFPSSISDADAMINACYSGLDPIRNFYMAFVPSDVAYQGFHNMRPMSYFVNFNSLDQDASEMWRTNYSGISKTNAAISLIPNLQTTNVDLINRLIAEAKFLRAYYYFQLVQTYGGVPLIDNLVQDPSALEGILRNSVEECYNIIINDLLDAINVLPNSYPDSELGKVTKWGAMGILAKVYMVNKDFKKAIEYLDQIINSNQFGLVADYAALFDETAEFVKMPDINGKLVQESVFQIRHLRNVKGNAAQAWSGSRDSEAGGVFGLGGGYDNMNPTLDLVQMFESGDIRREISIVYEVNGNMLESPLTPGANKITGKYLNRSAGDPVSGGTNTSQDIYVIRYSDILLLRAEAENELNGPTNALKYINLIRERANISFLSNNLSKEAMRDAIKKERAVELSFEGHRKYDLLRWGEFVETIKNTIEPNMKIPRENIREYHNLFPIPQREIDISNGSLVQNPGY